MITYKDSGVDIEAGYKAVKMMKEHVRSTYTKGVIGDIGSFGGLFELLDIKKYENPVLVSGTDGVGTKLQLAFMLDKHDTIGIDAVAMCVNDIVCQGAKPLFFLDYIACGKLKPERIADIVKGISEGCKMSKAALIGGETAEMPGFYKENEYDIAGFAVGIVDKNKIIDGSKIEKGDVLIGLASSGIHSNGYSLVRKLYGNVDASELNKFDERFNCTLGGMLLMPTRIYVDLILSLLENYEVKGLSHITGGGFIENIPRMLPNGLMARIFKGSWDMKPIFNDLKNLSGLGDNELYNTFNMGIGMVMAVSKEKANEILSYLKISGEEAFVIGEVAEGKAGVELC
ncbi:phosphoribosylformylglycinamidine cyclo-ligase [Oxobacter pfennigii]|uniref:Phosphoribosylformylglycinamidine cyclo-ligase n=1 Tax=Oxobacter pfennigii TaxID=36849 RepID=A0A0P8WDE2_9CLOT|nr:phosphoribosylformylglycinamidine cyclo-ligase [Oxobacter pfennigii]KPU45927.1 phosphoribosylformylglycinamidine cyclo-ligase [Oxobacter pfennigii]